MPDPTKFQRLLDIIEYLVSRRLPVSADELMRNVPSYAERWDSNDPRERESARRGFERDKDELRSFGIPIRTIPYRTPDQPDIEGYQLERRDFYLPYLNLVQQASGQRSYADRASIADVEITKADAPLGLDALRRVADLPGFPLAHEARSAFRKLAFAIDPHEYSSRSSVLFMDRPGAAELSERLRTLSDALLARKRVTFRYHGIYRGEETARDVAPYGMLFQHGHWYLVGHDVAREAVRVFRVGRMEDVAANRKSPHTEDYPIPDDFTLDAYIGRAAWELGEADERPVIARVLFRFPLSLWAQRNGHGTLESTTAEGAAVRRFELHQVDPFARWVLSLEGEAEVLEPDTLRQELKALARQVARAHGEASDAAP